MRTLIKKIDLAIFSFFIISAIFVGSFYYITNTIPPAQAVLDFGGRVTFYQPTCVLNIISGTCPNCPICGNILPGTCGGVQEIQFIPAPGSYTSFICPPIGYPFLGGIPAPGMQILGAGSYLAPTIIGVGL